MATKVESISREEFNRLRPPISLAMPVPTKELEFYGTPDKILVGTVFLDVGDNDFNYVVLGPDEHGQHRWIAGDSSFPQRQDAIRACIAKIEEIAATGDTVFPQGD